VSVLVDPVDPSRLIVTYNPHPKRWRIEHKTTQEIVQELDATICAQLAKYRGKPQQPKMLRAIQSELQVMIDSMQDAQYITIRSELDQAQADDEAEVAARKDN